MNLATLKTEVRELLHHHKPHVANEARINKCLTYIDETPHYGHVMYQLFILGSYMACHWEDTEARSYRNRIRTLQVKYGGDVKFVSVPELKVGEEIGFQRGFYKVIAKVPHGLDRWELHLDQLETQERKVYKTHSHVNVAILT